MATSQQFSNSQQKTLLKSYARKFVEAEYYVLGTENKSV